MCINCNIDNCNCDFISKEVNLTRQYIIQSPGEEGPQGPAGEVPTPIRAGELFDT